MLIVSTFPNYKFFFNFQMSDLKIEDLEAELPTHEPRYIALSYCYHHDDGRVSYPLVFIFVSPPGKEDERRRKDKTWSYM